MCKTCVIKILFPPSSDNTVHCIAVQAISRLWVHHTGDFNKLVHLYCRGPTLFQTYKKNYKAIPIQLKLTLFSPECKSVTTNGSDNRRNYIALLSVVTAL